MDRVNIERDFTAIPKDRAVSVENFAQAISRYIVNAQVTTNSSIEDIARVLAGGCYLGWFDLGNEQSGSGVLEWSDKLLDKLKKCLAASEVSNAVNSLTERHYDAALKVLGKESLSSIIEDVFRCGIEHQKRVANGN